MARTFLQRLRRIYELGAEAPPGPLRRPVNAGIHAAGIRLSGIPDGGVGTVKLADLAVTTPKMAVPSSAGDTTYGAVTKTLQVVLNDKNQIVSVVELDVSAGLLGNPTDVTASRALDTTYTPNATKGVVVAVSVSVVSEMNGTDTGRVFLAVKSTGDPTTAEEACRMSNIPSGGGASEFLEVEGVLWGFVPAGWNYRIIASAVAGAPTFALRRVTEWTQN